MSMNPVEDLTDYRSLSLAGIMLAAELVHARAVAAAVLGVDVDQPGTREDPDLATQAGQLRCGIEHVRLTRQARAMQTGLRRRRRHAQGFCGRARVVLFNVAEE